MFKKRYDWHAQLRYSHDYGYCGPGFVIRSVRGQNIVCECYSARTARRLVRLLNAERGGIHNGQ